MTSLKCCCALAKIVRAKDTNRSESRTNASDSCKVRKRPTSNANTSPKY